MSDVDIADLREKLAAAADAKSADDTIRTYLALGERALSTIPALLDELDRLRAVTDEQVTTAARAMYEEAYGEGDWEYAHPIETDLYLRRARIALDAVRQAGGDHA